jgi:hypothetical protein
MTEITITISREDASVAQFWLDSDAAECEEDSKNERDPALSESLADKAKSLGRVADAMRVELDKEMR